MNWYLNSPMNWTGSEASNPNPEYDTTSAQALNSVIDNVNNLIGILKDPADITTLRMGKSQLDLSQAEYERLIRHVSEASRSLNKIAQDYKVPQTYLLTPTLLRNEHEPTISTPETSHVVSSFTELKDENRVKPSVCIRMEPAVHIKQTVEIEPPIDSDCIAIGREFFSLEEAADKFRDYAISCGFNICKGNSKKDVYEEYACSARGKVRMRKVSDHAKERNRRSIKKMCKCHIILRKKEDRWIITTRKLQHTHELMSIEEIKKTAKNRYIPDEVKEKALMLYNQGVAPAKIEYEFENELGERCTWSMKDLYNMLYRHQSDHME